MYNSFGKSLTEFAYFIERISIVTKEFLNRLNNSDEFYNLIYKIYKSTQSINYEFIKLCYNVRADENLTINLSEIDNISIPVTKIKTINEFKAFINDSNKALKKPLYFICESTKKYSLVLNKEIDSYINLINDLNLKKTADDL